ncbi:MAG: lamin tail domain-containing protein [Flavobacteriales bacterium]|nr:lamin tail domain-containing protein [Flavobacteriales bacterium]
MKKILFTFAIASLSISGFSQVCGDVFISEIVEGWSNNKAVELYNPTPNPINLDEYGLVRFANGSTSYGSISYLTDITIQPFQALVFALDKRNAEGEGLEAPLWDELWEVADFFLNPNYDEGVWPMYFNGNDAIALIKANGEVLVDLFGKIGEGAEFGGWGPYGVDEEGDQLYISTDHTLARSSSVLQGITINPSSFDIEAQWDSLPANTFTGLGVHECLCFTSVEATKNDLIEIYPNPVSGDFLWVSAELPISEVKIMDLNGKIALTITFQPTDKKRKIDVSSIVQGLYILELTDQNGSRLRESFKR